MIIIENWKQYVKKNVNTFKLSEALMNESYVVVLQSVEALVLHESEIEVFKKYHKNFEPEIWKLIDRMSGLSGLKVSFTDKGRQKEQVFRIQGVRQR